MHLLINLNYSIIALITILSVIAVFINYKRGQKYQQQAQKYQQEAEQYLLDLEKQKQDFEQRNIEHSKNCRRELLEKHQEAYRNKIQLLIQKDEIIQQLETFIKNEIPTSKQKKMDQLIPQNTFNLWKDFEQEFMPFNANFYERIQAKAPKLSATDLKLCALIKQNFTGKEMAYILGISEGSVHVARHRLRQKFKLDRDVNLGQYINQI